MCNKTNKTVTGIHTSLRDAVLQTAIGQELIQIRRTNQQKKEFERKQQQELIVKRIRAFKSEVLSVFGYDLYSAVKPAINNRVKSVCVQGGEEYNRYMCMVKFSRTSKAAYNGTATLLLTGK